MDDLEVPHGTPISPPYLQRSHLTPQEWSETPGDNTWTKRLRSDVKLADSCHGSVSIASQLESSGLGFRIASGRNEFQSYQDVRKTSALRELAVQLKNAKTTQGRLFKSSRDSSATTMGGFYCDRAEDLFQNQLLHLLINWIRLCATHGWQIKGADCPVATTNLWEAKDELGGFSWAFSRSPFHGCNTW